LTFTGFLALLVQKLWPENNKMINDLIKGLINTLTSRLIQAVRKKTADSHVALRGNISAPVRVTDLVEASKDVASLVVCTRKKFVVGDVGFLSVTS